MGVRAIATAFCLVVLGACGGGGGGGSSSPPGWTITGTVVDETGAPVPDATVTIDLEETHTARTDSGGNYRLNLPQRPSSSSQSGTYPPYFTGVVEKPGMKPEPVFFEYDNGVITWDNQTTLEPARDSDVVFPSSGRVTHLGDSNYTGSINSQFQLRYATGTLASESIILDAERKARYTRLCVSLHAKGINPWPEAARTSLALGAQGAAASPLIRPLPPGNDDGSYSALNECFSLVPFQAGTVLDLEIRSGLNGSEYDDFEFIGLTAAFE